MTNKVSNWLTKDKSIISVLVVFLAISLGGTIGGALFNAHSVDNLSDSVKNLSQAVTEVDTVNANISEGQARTSCRTAVQADYDASISVILLAAIVDDLPPGLAGELTGKYTIDASAVQDFADSVEELALLSDGKICVGDNPTRADGTTFGDPSKEK